MRTAQHSGAFACVHNEPRVRIPRYSRVGSHADNHHASMPYARNQALRSIFMPACERLREQRAQKQLQITENAEIHRALTGGGRRDSKMIRIIDLPPDKTVLAYRRRMPFFIYSCARCLCDSPNTNAIHAINQRSACSLMLCWTVMIMRLCRSRPVNARVGGVGKY